MSKQLIAALKDDSPKVRRVALQKIAVVDSQQPISQEVLRHVRQLLDDPSEDVRFGAVLVVLTRVDKKATRALTQRLITDPDAKVRTLCAWALRQINDKRAIGSVVKGLKDRDSYVRSSCCRAIGDIGTGANVDAARQLFCDPSWEVRWDAGVAALKLGDETGLDVLKQVTKDPVVPKHFKSDLRRWFKEYKLEFSRR